MYHYVTDKEYLKQTYHICADIVNQLVQELKHYEIEAWMATVGRKRRGLVTQNEKEPIDYDVNLFIDNADSFRADELKRMVMEAFNEVLNRNGLDDCQDSTSVLSTGQIVLTKGNKTPFSIDVAIVKEDAWGNLHRLIHRKTGIVSYDQWYWNMAPNSQKLWDMEEYLKPKYWHKVKDAYLNKKNMYLTRNDYDHPSFVCSIEAVNEVYAQVRRQNYVGF